jgi:3-isopropylmalate/(R)-2-methylmalate dehydratase small subunit
MTSQSGRTWKFGDNVDTDVILPARYLMLRDQRELASHLMEDSDHTEFAQQVRPGDVIVAGRLFGMGSSREHAPIAIKAAGVAAVIAPSFARIFLRNAINIGLPVIENDTLQAVLEEGDTVEIDLAAGRIVHPRSGTVHHAAPYAPFMLAIVEAGGLVNATRARLGIAD